LYFQTPSIGFADHIHSVAVDVIIGARVDEQDERMSIVITVVTQNVVIQVSDVRLTSTKDGKPLDEKQRKSALVVGTDAAFIIGWTGFAIQDR
jgi:hypothetical protein